VSELEIRELEMRLVGWANSVFAHAVHNPRVQQVAHPTFLINQFTNSLTVFCFLSSVFCLLSVAGCQDTRERDSLAAQVEQLTQEKTQLQRQIEQSEAQNKQLKEQVQVLAALPQEAKLENLRLLASIKIGRYSGFYDKDKDGRAEKLIVYVQPLDEEGDKIKAAGDVDVQLWDLSKGEDGALLGQWHVAPGELKKLWFDTLLTINYRLSFDLPASIDPGVLAGDSLTIKVTFIDYLTGRVLTEQKAIKTQQNP